MAGQRDPMPLGMEIKPVPQTLGGVQQRIKPAPAGPIGMKAAKPAAKAAAPTRLDDAARLNEIRQLVKANNRSTLPDNMVVCQIYKESGFDKNAGVGKHGALGLMQVQRNAVKQVYKYRLQKELGHMPSDSMTKTAFADGDKMYESGQLTDEATNIQLGTEYMQYWLDKSPNQRAAYVSYRGDGGKEDYYERIKACADKLDQSPDNVQILYSLHGH